ncbi:MAG: hypothetical protein ACRCSG_07305 [Cellulosilyticaceae bacterium]
MSDNNTLKILKCFYNGVESMEKIGYKCNASRQEVREVLRGARQCGMISYSTKEMSEYFVQVNRKGLEKYLKAKGVLK